MKRLKRVYNIDDIKTDELERRLRGCSATIKATGLYSGYVLAQVVSYDTTIMWVEYSTLTCAITRADFYPTLTRTTYTHARKFCALFRNGKEVYKEYKRAAKCGYHVTYIK